MDIRITPMKGVSFQEVESILSRQLEAGLGRVEASVAWIDAVVRDLNGPRGGVDKACRLTAHFTSGEAVTVSDRGEDLPAVLARGAQRLSQAVLKLVSRRRDRRKSPSMAGVPAEWPLAEDEGVADASPEKQAG